jgi:hypothetical protein
MSAFRRWRKVRASTAVAPAALRLLPSKRQRRHGAAIDKHACALRTLRGAYWAGSVGSLGHAAFLCGFGLETKSSGASGTPIIIERAAPLPN